MSTLNVVFLLLNTAVALVNLWMANENQKRAQLNIVNGRKNVQFAKENAGLISKILQITSESGGIQK